MTPENFGAAVKSFPVFVPLVPFAAIPTTDFNTIGDDGQVGAMAAQLYARGAIDLLGFTIASGNQWRDQEVADCLAAVERMGIENHVKVYVGSDYPILHDYNDYLYEVQLFEQEQWNQPRMDTNERELKHLTGRRTQIVLNLPFKFSIHVYSCPFAVDLCLCVYLVPVILWPPTRDR